MEMKICLLLQWQKGIPGGIHHAELMMEDMNMNETEHLIKKIKETMENNGAKQVSYIGYRSWDDIHEFTAIMEEKQTSLCKVQVKSEYILHHYHQYFRLRRIDC